jgi:hypothetical protein
VRAAAALLAGRGAPCDRPAPGVEQGLHANAPSHPDVLMHQGSHGSGKYVQIGRLRVGSALVAVQRQSLVAQHTKSLRRIITPVIDIRRALDPGTDRIALAGPCRPSTVVTMALAALPAQTLGMTRGRRRLYVDSEVRKFPGSALGSGCWHGRPQCTAALSGVAADPRLQRYLLSKRWYEATKIIP